jgi:hypothetical protein
MEQASALDVYSHTEGGIAAATISHLLLFLEKTSEVILYLIFIKANKVQYNEDTTGHITTNTKQKNTSKTYLGLNALKSRQKTRTLANAHTNERFGDCTSQSTQATRSYNS